MTLLFAITLPAIIAGLFLVAAYTVTSFLDRLRGIESMSAGIRDEKSKRRWYSEEANRIIAEADEDLLYEILRVRDVACALYARHTKQLTDSFKDADVVEWLDNLQSLERCARCLRPVNVEWYKTGFFCKDCIKELRQG